MKKTEKAERPESERGRGRRVALREHPGARRTTAPLSVQFGAGQNHAENTRPLVPFGRAQQGLRFNVDLVLRRSVLTLKLWKC